LTATAHVTSAADFHIALVSGIDEITHLPLAPIDPADAALAAKQHVTVVTTTLSHRPDEGIADLPALHRENLALLKKAGVNVVFGVDGDSTVVTGVENIRKLGVYSDLELLRILTDATARAIFPKRKIGRLEDGYEASFLALDGNPLEDFGAIRKIATRVKQGHVIEVAPEKRSIAEAMMPILMSKGVDAAIAEYERLRRAEPDQWDFREPRLNQLGYAALNHGKKAEAIAIFALNARQFPKSSNVWDSLAEAYMLSGDKEQAIANYRKALEIDPSNKNAAEKLKQLLAQ
jgi:tetratricopeptide repeat protein/amidohydrolase family protein